MRLALGVAVLVSALLTIRGEYGGPRAMVYVFKPLATLLVLAAALLLPAEADARYRWLIAAGLACSLAGDVFLMLPGDRFVPGLTSFLAAHLCYIAAFMDGVPLGTAPALALPFAALGAVMLAVLWRGLGAMRVPVVVYVAVILVMAWRAAARWQVTREPGALLAAAGALLFLVSDAALAVDRFRAPYRSAQAVILATYVAAQWMIGTSAAVR